MGICILDRLILHDNLRRCLLSDARNARNIVRSISHQRLDIDKLFRRHLVLFFYILFQIIFHFSPSLLRLRDTDFYFLCGKLKKIPVSGKDNDLHARLLAASGKCPDQVVRLESCLFNQSDPHRFQNLFDHRNLLPELFRHRLSRAFILLVHLMPECRRMNIKGNRQIFRLFLLEYFKKNI